ncbi:MAG: putative DNA-binding domain-containing protein [Betaproteobacteria bacterium]|nr:putative DNA-binding domain-containing protein [Betaproteobacteria bacterium]
MSALPELQRAFGAALADARHAADAVPLFRDPPALARERLSVYRSNVHANCAKALAGAYPIVRAIVGEDFFEGLAREYARAHPSSSGDLNEYGAELAVYVAEFMHTQDLPYLPDVTRMEWLAHRAYYAADAPPFELARLAAMAPEVYPALRPVLAPPCALLESRWPLARIWLVHQDDYEGEVQVDLHAGPDRILVHRARWHARVTPLSRGEYRFLAGVRDGAALGEVLEAAVADDPEFDAGTALACWVAAGVIVDLT